MPHSLVHLQHQTWCDERAAWSEYKLKESLQAVAWQLCSRIAHITGVCCADAVSMCAVPLCRNTAEWAVKRAETISLTAAVMRTIPYEPEPRHHFVPSDRLQITMLAGSISLLSADVACAVMVKVWVS